MVYIWRLRSSNFMGDYRPYVVRDGVGIPFGVQCFKAAGLVLWPFGKEVNYGGGMGSFLVNILWIFFGGMELAFVHLVIGGIYCITVVGIPFELQHFKLAKLAFMPFGASVS